MQLGLELRAFFSGPTSRTTLQDGKSMLFSDLSLQNRNLATQIFKCAPKEATANWTLTIPMINCRRSNSGALSKLLLSTNKKPADLEKLALGVLKKVGDFFESWIMQLNTGWSVSRKTNAWNRADSNREKFLLIQQLVYASGLLNPKPTVSRVENKHISIICSDQNTKKLFLFFLKLRIKSEEHKTKIKGSSFAWITNIPYELHPLMGQWATFEAALDHRRICKATNGAFLKALNIPPAIQA